MVEASLSSLKWSSLAEGDPEILALAASEAEAIARAIAAQELLTDGGAELVEFGDRKRAIQAAIWFEKAPFEGYELTSTVGAMLIARAAIELVPAGHRGLRHTPLTRAGLLTSLEQSGIDPESAATLVGDWQGVPEGFEADPRGLSASALAGLAERALTRRERAELLNQVAFSKRCQARLAATFSLLSWVRALMPLMPPKTDDEALLVAIAGALMGRPDRVLTLLVDLPPTLLFVTLREFAGAQLALSKNQAPSFEDDGYIRYCPAFEESADAGDEDDDEDDEDEDDVLEIVEQAEAEGSEDEGHLAQIEVPLELARWGLRVDELPSRDQVLAWNLERRRRAGRVSIAGQLLGLHPLPLPRTTQALPLTPDPILLVAQSRGEMGDGDMPPYLDRSFEELLLPPLRGLLRRIVRAAEGERPSPIAASEAGNAKAFVDRLDALASLREPGMLARAILAVASLKEDASPEANWAKQAQLRFGSRADPETAMPESVARNMAASLVGDLLFQFALTLAVTTPSDQRSGDD